MSSHGSHVNWKHPGIHGIGNGTEIRNRLETMKHGKEIRPNVNTPRYLLLNIGLSSIVFPFESQISNRTD